MDSSRIIPYLRGLCRALDQGRSLRALGLGPVAVQLALGVGGCEPARETAPDAQPRPAVVAPDPPPVAERGARDDDPADAGSAGDADAPEAGPADADVAAPRPRPRRQVGPGVLDLLSQTDAASLFSSGDGGIVGPIVEPCTVCLYGVPSPGPGIGPGPQPSIGDLGTGE